MRIGTGRLDVKPPQSVRQALVAARRSALAGLSRTSKTIADTESTTPNPPTTANPH